MLPISVLVAGIVVACLAYAYLSVRLSEVYRRVEKTFPGPRALPLIGNALEFGDPEESYLKMMSFARKYERFFRTHLGNMAFVVLYDHRDYECVLMSNVRLQKGWTYRFLAPWIGTGLLTSAGEKWKSRRKIITPAFHFKILESYVDLFNANGAILCEKLSEHAGTGPFDVHQLVKLYALDNICETAMKIKVNALLNSESTYVRAIKQVAEGIMYRFFNPWLFNEFLFNMSRHGKLQREAIRVIHETSKRVIRERRMEISRGKEDATEQDLHCGKTRLAFVDILLSSTEGYGLSDEDICEEISTFMFEGHDTVSSGISFALYALAEHPEIQEKAYQEQLSIFGRSKDPPAYGDLQKMKYLDMVVKEAQRIYPSVPIIGRFLNEDIRLHDGVVLPKGCQISLLISQLHKDPKVWPDPETFDPENFSPEAVAARSPFAYVPFSAGSRNCIGQRFAMIEMKSCLSKILREFELKPSLERGHEVRAYAELVLVSKTGVKIRIEKRK